MRLSHLAAFVCVLSLQAADSPFSFQYEASLSRWTLANSQVEAVFALRPSGRFVFERIRHVESGDVWQAPAGADISPIRLTADQTTYDAGTVWKLIEHSTASAPRGGMSQNIVLEDAAAAARVRLQFILYPNQPVLRYSINFRNLGSRNVNVRSADMLSWNFDAQGRAYRVMRVNQWSVGGARPINFETQDLALNPDGSEVEAQSGAHGRHFTWLALRDGANRGLFAGWEFDGRARGSFRHMGSEKRLQLSSTIDKLFHPVGRNQEFSTPTAFIGLFHGGWDEAGFRTQRFTEAAFAKTPPEPDKFPYVIWDSWDYGPLIDEETLRRNAEVAARVGIELFVVDLGWARNIGDWHPDPAKFPSGMRALSDYVHSLGMKFGLHFAFAEAAADAPVLKQNPDWTASVNNGYFGARSLCLANRATKRWIVDESIRMIDEYKLDWILQDGENMVKECTKTTHSHHPQDSNYANAVDGLDAVLSEIQTRRPDTHWENCENGGNMMTFQMVKNYVTTITNDASGALASRQAAWGVTYPFSPRYADRYMPAGELTPYNTRSFMFGGPWIFMNRPAEWLTSTIEFASSEVRAYKEIRSLIRDGQVFHLAGRPEGDRIDAIQSYNAARDMAVAVVTRARTSTRSYLLKPRGVRPGATYRVRFQDDDRVLAMTGAQLAADGVRVELPRELYSEIVYIEPMR